MAGHSLVVGLVTSLVVALVVGAAIAIYFHKFYRRATADERRPILRGHPYAPTTTMPIVIQLNRLVSPTPFGEEIELAEEAMEV